uniref:hypothetical protein n=1 Tax=Hypnea nidulans TaxID=673449 RepID=UPI0027DA5B21|nr:hypothetical protein REP55_pgp119 [Hypnea nidulans]WCH54517.1 hypothetical protein [Hypnea nidulans]
MNLFIGTGKIISNPRLYRIKQKVFLSMHIVLLKKNKKTYSYSTICIIKGKLAIHLFDVLKKSDIIIIEGYITVKLLKSSYNNKNIRMVIMQAKRLCNLKKITYVMI